MTGLQKRGEKAAKRGGGVRLGRGSTAQGARGAAAIEFAFVFPVLLMVFYGTVVYGYLFVLHQSMTFAAQTAVEAAVAVDPQQDAASYDGLVIERARQTAAEALRWLPAAQRSRIVGDPDAGEQVQVDFPSPGYVRVRLVYAPNTEGSGFFPILNLPSLGSVPPLPAQLIAESRARI